MVFLNNSYLNHTTLPPSIWTGKVQSVQLKNAQFYKSYMSTLKPPSSSIPTSWDKNTVMLAKYYNHSINPNKFDLDDIDTLLIKRREKNSSKWITLYNLNLNENNNSKFIYKDYTVPNVGTFEYALIPYSNGSEGGYVTKEITTNNSDALFISDGVYSYSTELEINVDIQRNFDTKTVSTINDKYPKSVSLSNANYISGSISALFLKKNNDNCEYEPENSNHYRDDISIFLANKKSKILKIDDVIYLINVTSEITNKKQEHNLKRIMEFNFTEIGDAFSEKDLYYAGIINVPEMYWSDIYD